MHICLDFIPELLSQPCINKQVFAVELLSYLAVQYALPKSMSVAHLTINTLLSLLGGKLLFHKIMYKVIKLIISCKLYVLLLEQLSGILHLILYIKLVGLYL